MKNHSRYYTDFLIEIAFTVLKTKVKSLSDNINNSAKYLDKLRKRPDGGNKEEINLREKQLALFRKLKKFCKVLLYPFDKGLLYKDEIDLTYFTEGGVIKSKRY